MSACEVRVNTTDWAPPSTQTQTNPTQRNPPKTIANRRPQDHCASLYPLSLSHIRWAESFVLFRIPITHSEEKREYLIQEEEEEESEIERGSFLNLGRRNWACALSETPNLIVGSSSILCLSYYYLIRPQVHDFSSPMWFSAGYHCHFSCFVWYFDFRFSMGFLLVLCIF